MCAESTTDCYPSDSDNPSSCSVTVRVPGGMLYVLSGTNFWFGMTGRVLLAFGL